MFFEFIEMQDIVATICKVLVKTACAQKLLYTSSERWDMGDGLSVVDDVYSLTRDMLDW